MSIPLLCYLIIPQKISKFCEKLSDSNNLFNSDQENTLALIVQVLTAGMLLHSFEHLSTPICNAFQDTRTPMLVEFGENIINAIAGWFFLKQLGLVAIDVGYIPTELMAGLALAYTANKTVKKIGKPYLITSAESGPEKTEESVKALFFTN